MYHVWDGSEWNATKALKVWTGSTWAKNYKFKVRTSISWLPTTVSDIDTSNIIKWGVEAPTPPPPPPTPTHPVPDLAGKTIQEAEALLTPLLFGYTIANYIDTPILANDNKIVPNSQQPAAGQLLTEGSDVVFNLYNFVQPTATVPNIEGLLTGNANNAIVNAGFVVGTPLGTEETYDTNLIGKVVVGTQFPAGGSVEDTGTSIIYDYYIQKPFATVPDLVGDDDSTVFTQLSNAQLTIGNRTTFATSNPALDNKVKSTFPVANTQVQEGSEVDYVVYEKSLSVVPSLVGLTVQQAEVAVNNVGLFLVINQEVETTVQSDEGKVRSQTQSANSEVPDGSNVNITTWVANTTTVIPNFNLMTSQQAEAARLAAEINLLLSDVVYTADTNLQYKVVPNSQDKAAGSTWPIWTTVSVDYYLPLPNYTVPSIIGLTPSSQGTAINANFTWGMNSLAGTATETVSNFGKVATQAPFASASAPAQPINYGVYTDGRPIVPNVVGQAQSTAQQNITSAGLNSSVTTTPLPSAGFATVGTVKEQNPVGGTRLATGSTVSLVVWSAYVPQPQTKTATISIGYGGDIPWQWTASYRDTKAVSSSIADGARRTTSQPFYVGRYDTTNETQQIATAFDFSAFSAKGTQITGLPFDWTGANGWKPTGATFRFWANSGVAGNDNNKALRLGSYGSSTSTSPSAMTEASVNLRGIILNVPYRGSYGYATANTTLLSDCFQPPVYPVVVYPFSTNLDHYAVNDGDLRWDVTIQWTEYA
jgi:beta-lactam-binding protein with PASTA domain